MTGRLLNLRNPLGSNQSPKTAPMDKAEELMGISKGLEVLRSSLSDIMAEYNAVRMGEDA